jgi:hypothetical protein
MEIQATTTVPILDAAAFRRIFISSYPLLGTNIAIIPEIFLLGCGEAKRSKVLDNTKRHIPGPEILLPRIKRVVRWCADVKDAETGKIRAAMNHVKLECISDMPGQNCDYYITSETGCKTLM